jgi:hypothetical protein
VYIDVIVGPVRIFVSSAIGTRIASFRQTTLELNREVV